MFYSLLALHCSGGRDLSGNKRTNKSHSFDQQFDKYNLALRVSCEKGYPVRVVRSPSPLLDSILLHSYFIHRIIGYGTYFHYFHT